MPSFMRVTYKWLSSLKLSDILITLSSDVQRCTARDQDFSATLNRPFKIATVLVSLRGRGNAEGENSD